VIEKHYFDEVPLKACDWMSLLEYLSPNFGTVSRSRLLLQSIIEHPLVMLSLINISAVPHQLSEDLAFVTGVNIGYKDLRDFIGAFHCLLSLLTQGIYSIGLSNIGVYDFIEVESVNFDWQPDDVMIVPLQDEVVVGVGESVEGSCKGAGFKPLAEVV
jgi:hypothetical protein